MIPVIKRIISKEILSVHKAAYIIGAASFLSMAIGIVRERLLVSTLGRGEMLDVYYASLKLPDLLFTIFISLISAFVIIPFVSSKDESDRNEYLASLVNFFLFSSGFVALLAFVFTPQYLEYFFPNLVSGRFASDFIFMSRILLLQFIMLGLSNVFLSVVQLKKRFTAYSIAPIVYNLGIIFGIIFLYPTFGLRGIVYGVLFGAVLHIAISFGVSGLSLSLKLPKKSLKDIFEMLKLSYPRAVSLFVLQAVMLYVYSVLSELSKGAISAFQLAIAIQTAPVAIIGMSYSVAAFPTLSKFYADRKIKEFTEHVQIALRHIIFWSSPIIFMGIVFRAHIVRLFFGSSNFSWHDTSLVSAILIFPLLAVVSQSVVILISRAYYAANMVKLPLYINVLSTIVFVVFLKFIIAFLQGAQAINNTLAEFLKVNPGGDVVIVSVSFAFMVYMTFMAVVFMYFFSRDFMSHHDVKVVNKSIGDILLASLVSAVVAKSVLIFLSPLVSLNGFLPVFFHAAFAFAPALFAFLATLYILDNLELKETLRILNSRWRRK